jgi:F-type H+-transporting ATPase subunit alpha
MKLQMAQFRELEAFAQFASDLDPATKSQLERGLRIQELLKQSQYSPVEASVQVVLFYAAQGGYLDSLELSSIAEWEKKCVEFLTKSKEDLLEKIRKDWNDQIENELKEALDEFSDVFKT